MQSNNKFTTDLDIDVNRVCKSVVMVTSRENSFDIVVLWGELVLTEVQ